MLAEPELKVSFIVECINDISNILLHKKSVIRTYRDEMPSNLLRYR